MDSRRRELLSALTALESWGSARGWRGSDPYDGLNATRLLTPLKRSRRGRQALTQLVKRSPLDLRPALGIAPERSAAALANVVSSYALGGFLDERESRQKLEQAVRELEALRSPGFEEPCWGYHFDVQTRVFFYPRGAPNTIATSFAGQALLDAYETTGEASLLELAEGAGEFFLRHVPQTGVGRGAFFGYLAGDRTPIHNANMLVCALLARLAEHTGRDEFRAAATAGVSFTASRQRRDGSWPYGELPHLAWVDGFHTGYVLECLLVCTRAGIDGGATAALERGLDHYRRELFLVDGTPRYMPSSTYPIDAQCAAQGIETFARAASTDASLRQKAWAVFDYALRRLRRRDGAFVFQRRRLWTNRTPHVRWSAGPMLLALTYLLRDTETAGGSA